MSAFGQIFGRDTQAIFYNWKPSPVQRMLDFDFLCGEYEFHRIPIHHLALQVHAVPIDGHWLPSFVSMQHGRVTVSVPAWTQMTSHALRIERFTGIQYVLPSQGPSVWLLKHVPFLEIYWSFGVHSREA